MATMKMTAAHLGNGWVQEITGGELDNRPGTKMQLFKPGMLPEPEYDESISARTMPVLDLEIDVRQRFQTLEPEPGEQYGKRVWSHTITLLGFKDTGKTVTEKLYGSTRENVIRSLERRGARSQGVSAAPAAPAVPKVTKKRASKRKAAADVDAQIV